MLFSLSSFMKTAAILAVALTCVCQAQVRHAGIPSDQDLIKAAQEGHYDQIPALSCQQFETLFPEAIKYPKQAYYTLRVNGSQVACFYDRHEHIVLAFVLTQAKRNLNKLEDILHLHYDERFTDEEKSYHKALLYHKYHLFRDYNDIHSRLAPVGKTVSGEESEPDSEDKLTFSTVIGIAGLLDSQGAQRNIAGHPQSATSGGAYRFQGWNRQGLAFGKGKKTQLFFSTHDAQQPIVHLEGNQLELTAIFPPGNYFPESEAVSSKTYKSALRLSKLKRLTHVDSKLHTVIGEDGKGVFVIGVPNRKQGLHQIPSCPPQPFPKLRSEWPSDAAIASINKEMTRNIASATPANQSQQIAATTSASSNHQSEAAKNKSTYSRPDIPTDSDVLAANNLQLKDTKLYSTRKEIPIPQQLKVNIPLTPKNALETYLNHLHSMGK